MHLTGISLQNFRNYTNQTFLFPQQTTIIVGKNTAGKTSLMEAINLLATGNSFRAEEISEMIKIDQEIGRVKGKIVDAEPTELEVTLTRGEIQGKKTQSRLYTVNQVRRLKKSFVGHFFTVVFRPEDMRLVEGSPSRRRQYIDTILNVTDRGYALALKTYEAALKRRNRLLPQIQEGLMQRSVLSYWNSLLLKHGQVLQEQRRKFFGFFTGVIFPLLFTVSYQPSIINAERQTEYLDREIAAGHTLIGPHKDDFTVQLHDRPISLYGSRGQQRLAVLWLKICELEFIKQTTHTQPILLLDDILSELDIEHRQDVLSLLNQGQAILTTTEEKMAVEVAKVVADQQIIHL